jgi:SAM-dependent methyltransferase
VLTNGSYTQATYGDRIADLYDGWVGGVFAADECVDRVAELAGAGRVLELGVGTGRVAVPLVERGLQVVGIDASTAMLDRLASKYDGPSLTRVHGDFADVDVAGDFSLVLVAADTLFMLTTQDEQVRCFTNVAARLAPAGVFVVEAFVPGATRYLQGHDTAVRRVTADSVLLGVATHDPVAQRLDAQQILLAADGIRLIPGALRYAWPSELDLMARLAGLRLRDRWSDWRGSRFTAASARHISVYTGA